jgi:hypothetical protein
LSRTIRLSHLQTALAARGYDTSRMPSHHRVWRDAVQGRFAAKADGRIWETTEAAIPEIAALYGMELAEAE